MNYIGAFFSDAYSVSERIESKKYFFGFTEELEISKLVYGFFMDFLDSKVKAEDQENYEKLGKYEFFAGSVTWDRFKKELGAFLDSPFSGNLGTKTREMIREYAGLLEASQDISNQVDLHRAFDLRLIFLAATGMGASFANNNLEIEPEHLKGLAHQALKKVGSLEVGGKAVFLMGSVLHETLLFVERLDENRFKLCYHDSNMNIHFYECTSGPLLQEAFWMQLYDLKFSTDSSAVKEKMERCLKTPEVDPWERSCSIRTQQKNTCHFRCHFSVLKYLIMCNSDPVHCKAYLQWNLFKEGFGNFLLSSRHLKDEQLRYFSEKRQAKRSFDTQRAIDFQECVRKGWAKETLEIYRCIVVRSFCGFSVDTSAPDLDPYALIKKLKEKEKNLLKHLEKCLVSPEDIAPFFAKTNNPWVRKTFEVFKERFIERQKYFEVQLQAELDAVASGYNPIKEVFEHSACEILDAIGIPCGEAKVVAKVPIADEKIEKLLDLFERHPEWLHFLDQKPCIQTVLLQAISLGNIECVERIFQKLPEEDKSTLFKSCSCEFDEYFPLKRLEAMQAFVLKYPNSPFSPSLAELICMGLIRDRKFSEFLLFSNQPSIASMDIHIYSIRALMENEVLGILSTLASVQREIQDKPLPICGIIPFLFRIEEVLFKNPHLLDEAAQFDVPGLKPILDRVHLSSLCQNGMLREIRKLPVEMRQISDPFHIDKFHIKIRPKDYRAAIDLMKESPCSNFALVVFRDLFEHAFLQGHKKSQGFILESYLMRTQVPGQELAEWYNLRFEGLLLLSKFLVLVEEEGLEKKYDLAFCETIIRALIIQTDNQEQFNAAREVLDALPVDFLRRVVKERNLGNAYHLIKDSDRSLLAMLMRQDKCRSSFNELVNINSYFPKKLFLDHLHLILADVDFSNQRAVYQDIIKPIFYTRCIHKNESIPRVADLINSVQAPEDFRLLVALAFLENGNKVMALEIFPDEQKLDAVLTSIASS